MVTSVPDGVPQFPVQVVVQWLRPHGVDLALPVTVELVSGGRSNLTYLLSDAGGRRVVLRRPPLGNVLETAHDMTREWRFISALRRTPVPVPVPLALAEGPDPLGVPFYVMSHVEGLVLHDAGVAAELSSASRAAAAASLIDTIAALHQVDIDEVGLGDIAKREDYVGRQLRRWKRQWDQSICTDITAVDALYERLRSAVPAQQRTSIVHGDFRLGNMMCGPDGAIRAVLDWELATLGDPLADFAWLLASWLEANDQHEQTLGLSPPSVLDGFPTRLWIIDRYSERTGADLSGLDFYLAFAHWRGACINAGVLTRYRAGAMGDDGFDPAGMHEAIAARADTALELLGA